METYYIVTKKDSIELARSMFGENMGSHVLTLKHYDLKTDTTEDNNDTKNIDFISHEEDFFGNVSDEDSLLETKYYNSALQIFSDKIRDLKA